MPFLQGDRGFFVPLPAKFIKTYLGTVREVGSCAEPISGVMECWNDGKMGKKSGTTTAEMERKNVNRGFKKLRVWQDAVSLYMLAGPVFGRFPYPFLKVASNSIDAAHSISRNIAEGYCRKRRSISIF
jgi:hypothetical protein